VLLLSAAVFFAPSFNAFPRLSLLGTPLSPDLVVGEGGADERGAVLLLLLTVPLDIANVGGALLVLGLACLPQIP